MTTPSPSPCCVLGIDYAVAADHVMCWRLPDGSTHHASVQPTPKAVADFIDHLCDSLPGDGLIYLGIEGGAHALLEQFARHPRFVVFALNPASVKAFCKALRVAGTKNDKVDAEAIGLFVSRHHDSLRRYTPMDSASAELAQLAADRRVVVDQRTRCGNALVAALRYNCPGLVEAFGGCSSPLAKLVMKWSTLGELKARRPSTLNTFLRNTCRMRSPERIQQVLDAVLDAPAEAAHPAKEFLARTQASLYLSLYRAVREYDQRILQARDAHPLDEFAESFPGLGGRLGPRIIGFLGNDRSRFPTAEDMLLASGIAPVTLQSGKGRPTVRSRWACNKFDRQTFHEFARCSLAQCTWANAYYQAQRKAGKSAHVAYRALAFKWIRIIHACWQRGELYDESKVRSQYSKQTREAA